jgi:hypothetical protein
MKVQKNILRLTELRFGFVKNYKSRWLLNYRGGSFFSEFSVKLERMSNKSVGFKFLSDAQQEKINEITSPSQNMETVAYTGACA